MRLPRGRPIEWEEWKKIIDAIKGKVTIIEGKRRGPARDAALGFYKGALGQLDGFKDAYRNMVMHARGQYDEFEAAHVMAQVRALMEGLSLRLDEKAKKQIKWGLR